jgi:predicted DCC family thiol-disulfide oxidoreductase YuxK
MSEASAPARASAQKPDEDDVTLIYDGDCPVCTIYGCNVQLEPGSGTLVRVNARDDPQVQAEMTAAGLDLDEGMVVRHRGRLYHGAEAMHVMAVHGSRRGIANRVNRLLFRSRGRAEALYPFMRAGRNALLRVLGRKKIGNLKADRP